jgi:4-carboxymuconolactone decarboxylase
LAGQEVNMSDLPDPKIPADELEAYRDVYRELIGFLPPRIEARTDLLSRLDPQTLALQEELRRRLMYPGCFDTKTSQLMLFAILLGLLSDAARLHAIAARRAGASWEELNAVVGLCFLFRGLPAANLGAQVLQEISNLERKQDVSPAGVEKR